MGLLDNDSYLTNVSKICQKIKNKGSFRITIKRDRLFEDKPSIKKGFKKGILAKRANELEKDSNLMSKLLFKVKQNDNAFSTKVFCFSIKYKKVKRWKKLKLSVLQALS